MEQKEELYKTLDEFGNPVERPAESGVLGNYANIVDVPNRPNYVYVRLSSGLLVEAYNNLAPSTLNLHVLVGTNPQRPSELKVMDIMLGMHPNGIGTPVIPKHGTSHEWPGVDTVYLGYRQLLPLRTTVVAPLEVSIYPGWYVNSARESKYYPGSVTNINLTSHKPTSGARWVLLTLDGSGSVGVVAEGTGSSYFGLTALDIPTIPENEIGLSAIRLYAGQTAIKDNALPSTDVIDLRFVPQSNLNTAGSTATWGAIVGTLSNQTDLQLALGGKTEEAPINGNQYVRKDAGWAEISVDVEEAPIDGKQYARKDGAWEEVISPDAQIIDDLTSQIDGSGSIYSLLSTYVVSSVYWNGQRLYETQYTDATGTLVLDFIPDVTDTLVSFGVSEAGLISVANIAGVATAGNSKYYGTNVSGMPGFHSLPSGGGGSVVKIDEQLLDDAAAEIEFDVPDTYTHLEIRLQGRGSVSATEVEVRAIINEDTGSNYSFQLSVVYGGSILAVEGSPAYAYLGAITGANAPANTPGQISAKINNYQGAFHKSYTGEALLRLGTGAADYRLIQVGGIWASTSTITKIKLYLASGNFVAGTLVSLYGIE